jgi:adenylate cyclase
MVNVPNMPVVRPTFLLSRMASYNVDLSILRAFSTTAACVMSQGAETCTDRLEADPTGAALSAFPRPDGDRARFKAEMKRLGGAPSSHTLAYWLDALGQLQRSPAGSQEFFAAAAHAVIQPGGLDAALVLLRERDSWRVAARHPGESNVVPQRSILDRVVAERQTLFHDARTLRDSSQEAGSFVVAAPIVGDAGEVTGVVYGVRFDHTKNQRRGIRPLEAQFVQAVADAVSAGLIRRERESDVVRLQTRLELAFSPAVARELERNPQLLDVHECEVTILFADLRGFTALSERLSPSQAYSLLGDVMDRCTQDVMATGGVLIDYYGDGLAAFWNAPLPQPGHALRACQAALAMQGDLQLISDDWLPITGQPLQLGIGIHTATTLVGNAGSRSRIKYGPRGQAMNLASRVQNATRQLGRPILLTRSTAEQLAGQVALHSVSTYKLDGFAQSVELFAPS